MWDKTVPSVTFQGSSNGTALAQLWHAWSYPHKNLYKILIFCRITVKFDMGLVVPLCFSVRSPMLKSLLRHIFEKKNLADIKFHLFHCIQAHITL